MIELSWLVMGVLVGVAVERYFLSKPQRALREARELLTLAERNLDKASESLRDAQALRDEHQRDYHPDAP